MVCHLQMKDQKDIKRLLETQPVLVIRKILGHNGQKDLASSMSKSHRLVKLIYAKAELRS